MKKKIWRHEAAVINTFATFVKQEAIQYLSLKKLARCRVTFYPTGRDIKQAKIDITTSDSQLTLRQVEIISILEKREALSTKGVHNYLKKPPSERSVRDDLKQLEALGKVKAEGATNKRKGSLIG